MQTLPAIPQVRPTPRGELRLLLGAYDRIITGKVAYTCADSTTTAGYVLARVDNPAVTETITREQMDVLRHAPGFRHDRDFFNPAAAKARLIAGVAHLRDLPEKEQKDILFKQDWCLRFLKRVAAGEANLGDDKMGAAILAISEEMDEVSKLKALKNKRKMAGKRAASTTPGPSTKYLRKWLKKLISGNMNPLALRDRRCLCSGNWTSPYDAAVYAIMYKHALRFMSPERPTRTELHEAMESEITALNDQRAAATPALEPYDIPKYDRFCDEVKGLSKLDVMVGREGPDVARNYFRVVGDGLVDVVRPLQRVEVDEWTVHLHILFIRAGLWDALTDAEKKAIERVRMVLCVAVDCATRCILAMSLRRTASSRNAIQCLDMGLSEKQDYADAAGALTPWDMYGTWETACTDPGSSFANDDFCVRVIDAGITFEIAAAGVPFLRGTVERLLQSIDQKMAQRFAGRTGSNVVDKGDYDSQARASIDVDELAQAFVRYAVDHYHNSPHAGLRGEMPRACWLRLTELYGVMPPPDPSKRRAIFGVAMRATADADGLRVLGVQFHAPEVDHLFTQVGATEVEVRVDLKDMGVISAKIGETWIAIDGPEALAGVHVDDWIAAEAELRRRHADMAALTRPIVLSAAKYLNDLADKGRARIGIADTPTSALALARAHRNMKIGVSFVRDAKAAREANRGLFDDALEVTGSGNPDAPPESPTTARKPRKAATAPNTAKRKKATPKVRIRRAPSCLTRGISRSV
jgi:putative transposase